MTSLSYDDAVARDAREITLDAIQRFADEDLPVAPALREMIATAAHAALEMAPTLADGHALVLSALNMAVSIHLIQRQEGQPQANNPLATQTLE